MNEMPPEKLVRMLLANRLLADGEQALLSAGNLAADGSSRRFIRIAKGGEPLCLAVMPASPAAREMAEAAAAWHIGRHLQRRGIPVPQLLARDEESGTIFFEDLGDTRLHDLVSDTDFSDVAARGRLLAIYREVLERLVEMQVEGAHGFHEEWCWDTPFYDRELMLERESGYFLRAFWNGLLAMETPAGLQDEFAALADLAAEAPAGFFLHRDFQSRNIMLADGRVRFIDFQGGRKGPLGYDLASLLIDPYSALPDDCCDQLFAHYLRLVESRLQVDARDFRRQYAVLALHRNLQIIGAFAFLSQVRGKTFFAGFIVPALRGLEARLRQPVFEGLRVLPGMVVEALAQLKRG